jgi:hypothetical protein
MFGKSLKLVATQNTEVGAALAAAGASFCRLNCGRGIDHWSLDLTRTGSGLNGDGGFANHQKAPTERPGLRLGVSLS